MDDLIPGKIHTIRANYDYWAKHDGKECSLRYWSGKPRRSKQIEFCRKVIHVQELFFENVMGGFYNFFVTDLKNKTSESDFAKNDGFSNFEDMLAWFHDYPSGYMAILHFTDFRY
jgi:hypothetical protein